MDSPVVVTDLRKTFYDEGRGEVRAVDGVSFTCKRGEIYGLLGANGAGKTTTLRMLATILTPTSGDARVMEKSVVRDPEEVRRHIGYHSASTALYPRLTTRETLEFFARINRYPEARVKARAEELIERFALQRIADTRVEKLSTGMKQKVSLARTVAHDPPVLIFDEPTAALDVLNALEVRAIIAELRNMGKAVLFSTHLMTEAEKLCDRIAIIHGGKLLADNTLEELRAATGLHYLEDIFVRYVEASGEAVRAEL
jgi:sodium transport system ATP-binding protein